MMIKPDKRKTYSCHGLAPVLAHTKGEARAAFKRQLLDHEKMFFDYPQRVERLPVGFAVMEEKKEVA